MKKRLYVLLLPIITLILEMLPFGVEMKFAPSEKERITEVFAYFDPISFGYGNPWPFFTSLLTCIILILLVIYIVNGFKIIFNITRIITVLAFLASLVAVVFTISSVTILSIIITITLLLETIVLCIPTKN